MEGLRWINVLIVVLALLAVCNAQTTLATDTSSMCVVATSCGSCISMSPLCAWCAEENFFGDRCDAAENLLLTNCTDLQNPVNYNITITKNLELSNAGDAPLGQAVQIYPQELHLSIRKGETAQIEMSVRQAEDYPVDMYYLMDLSESMKEDLVNLRSLAGEIVTKMQELTQDFRVGFGSFVDKGVIPFASVKEDGSINLGNCLVCEQPYLFQNGLSLTNSTADFEQVLMNTGYSSSKDSPEAGLDALLQVAVCDNEIGWRDSARHIVVFATDAPFHSAGDGRLGGIITPNDGRCHLNTDTGLYESAVLMDYPSVGHLSSVIQDQSIIVMLVVSEDVEEPYLNLAEFIPGSRVGQLASDSTNILYWIEKLYGDITEEVSLLVQAPDELVLGFTSHCLNGVSTPNSKTCGGLAIGDTVNFTIDITAAHCIDGGSTSFIVRPVGFSEELLVHVDVVCDCDCESGGVPNSPLCNTNGTYQCGKCECNENRYGEQCQCSGESTSVGDDRTACMAPGSTTVCSGRGECVCGECVCEKQKDPTHIVSGRYCQCDNFNCPLYDGQLCGGPERGTCECDQATQQSRCFCTSSYSGDSCSCLTSQAMCVAPTGLICNAHGSCECGACQCDINSPFKGDTCFDCATCSGQCEVYQECVQCLAFETGPLTPEQCSMCTVQVVKEPEFPDVDYPYNCSVPHADNCSIVFVPHFIMGEDNVPVIYVLEEPVCPLIPKGPGVDVRWVAVGLAIFIVIVGIILILLYKCYIMWLDKKEYDEWLKEKNSAQFSQNLNPLYKPASSKHMNPAYGTQFSDTGEKQGIESES